MDVSVLKQIPGGDTRIRRPLPDPPHSAPDSGTGTHVHLRTQPVFKPGFRPSAKSLTFKYYLQSGLYLSNFSNGVRVLGPSRLLGQRPCQTRVAPPMWGKGISQPDNVVLYWFTMTQCCIETTLCLKKVPTIKLSVTLSNLN